MRMLVRRVSSVILRGDQLLARLGGSIQMLNRLPLFFVDRFLISVLMIAVDNRVRNISMQYPRQDRNNKRS